MGMSTGVRRGIVVDPNVVPLIDILLVLLVIFMVIPHRRGLDVALPQPAVESSPLAPPQVVVVQVLADGSLRLNQQPVNWEDLEQRLSEVSKVRADRTAFIRGDGSVEFAVVARVIDVMHTAGIKPIGLLTQDPGNGL